MHHGFVKLYTQSDFRVLGLRGLESLSRALYTDSMLFVRKLNLDSKDYSRAQFSGNYIFSINSDLMKLLGHTEHI